MMTRWACPLLAMVLFAAPLAAQGDAEQFDLAGLPPRPTTFLEQQIHDLIREHAPGDRVSAAAIQRKLAQYYRQVGDSARARVAEDRARRAAEEPAVAAPAPAAGPPSPEPEPPSLSPACAPGPDAPATPGGFDGQYYRAEGGSSQSQWTFTRSGAYRYTHISGAAGTAVRSSERGRYSVEGQYLVVQPCSEAQAFATPSVGGRGAVLGGGAGAGAGPRRVRFAFPASGPGEGIVLDGVRYRWRSW